MTEVLHGEFPSGVPLVEGMIYSGENTLLVAPPKTGKTIFTTQLALSVIAGARLAGMWSAPTKKSVLYVSLENSMSEIQAVTRRLVALEGVDEKACAEFTLVKAAMMPLNDGGFEVLEGLVEKHKPSLLVLDPLYRVHKGTLVDDGQVALTTGRLNMLTDIGGHATIVVAHEHRQRRTPEGRVIDEGGEAYFGSYVLAAWVQNLYRLEFDATLKTGRLSCEVERTPRFGLPKDLTLVDSDDKLGFVAQEAQLGELAQAMQLRLPELEGLSYRQAAKVMETHAEALRRAARELAARGLVEILGGRKGQKTTLHIIGGSHEHSGG